MRCYEIMTSNPRYCSPSESVTAAARIMKGEDVGAVPVCEGDRLVGIVTDRDLAVNVLAENRDPDHTEVQHIMTRAPFACTAEEDIQTAIDAMCRYQVRRVPIVDWRGELVGIISQGDVAVRAGWPEKTSEVLEQISRAATMQAAWRHISSWRGFINRKRLFDFVLARASGQ